MARGHPVAAHWQWRVGQVEVWEFMANRYRSAVGSAMRRWRLAAVPVALVCALGAVSCVQTVRGQEAPAGSPSAAPLLPTSPTTPAPNSPQAAALPAPRVVPVPVSMRTTPTSFALTGDSRIVTPSGSPEATRVGEFLAGLLRPSTGYRLPVSTGDQPDRPGDIVLTLTGDDRLGTEGYDLTVTDRSVTLRAARPAGLFFGVQTLRQLLPAQVESHSVRPGPWLVPGVQITDHPRFAWRGASLDVARHFFTVAEVQRYIDLLSLYKMNTLHLHLSDDQGWRIAVDGWPRLTSVGGRTEVGGGPGGFYTQDDYRRIVNYAAERYVTVVPEIELPGHINAALVSYPELTCDGQAPPPFTRIGGPPVSLCVDKPVVHQFLDDVVGQLAALTPGPYLHVGGDEVLNMAPAAYAGFVNRVQQVVRAHGKTAVGWQEITDGDLSQGTVVQYWDTNHPADPVRQAAAGGARIVLSPASRAYLDMKYDKATRQGLTWAGYVTVQDAYSWDPAKLLPGVGESSVLGVEAALWSETLPAFGDVEFMVLPRLPALAELGWSPASTHDWEKFRQRLAAQAPRWSAMSVDFFRSPQVPWPG